MTRHDHHRPRLPASLTRAMLLAAAIGSAAAPAYAAPPAPASAPAPAPQPAASNNDVVAQRGAVKFTVAEVKDLVDHADPAVRAQVEASPQALAEFVRDRLLRQVLLQEARAKNWEDNPEVQARLKDARETTIVQTFVTATVAPDPSYPSPTEVAAAYEANKARFSIPRQYHLMQIAVLVPNNATAAQEEEARRKAVELKQQAVKPKADFSEIAKKFSQERVSGDRGGDLGWVREDQILPALRDTVNLLQEGAVSDPIRSPTAFHIIKIVGTRPASVAPIADVKDAIAQTLRQQRAQQNARQYIADMLQKEPIQLNEIELAKRITGK